jgi:hypothetical protein
MVATTASSATPPDSARGDISALAVWFTCAALYLVFMLVAAFLPGVLQGPALHPVTGEPNWEWGLLEQVQNAELALSIVLAILVIRGAESAPMRGWLAFVLLGLIYLLGEETSWGQHYLRWDTGGWFAEHNDQAETNLHNTSYWLDQAPRNLLYLGMVLGGILHPLTQWLRKGRGLIDNPWWLAPTAACVAPVIFAFIAGSPKAIDKLEILPFQLQFYRASEMEECFMYAFFVVYLLSLGARLRFRRAEHG